MLDGGDGCLKSVKYSKKNHISQHFNSFLTQLCFAEIYYYYRRLASLSAKEYIFQT
jgi:hypothetical protein